MSPEGRHCHQQVGTVTRGSALSPEGQHCHQRVSTVTRGSAASRCRQRVGTVARSVTCPPAPPAPRQGCPEALVGVLERWWASWSVGAHPRVLVGVLEHWWASWSSDGRPRAVIGVLKPWHCQERRGTARTDVASPGWTWCPRD